MGGENLDALKTAATDPATVLSFLSQVAPKYRRYDAWGRPIDVSINQGLAGAAQAFAGARNQNLQNQMLNELTQPGQMIPSTMMGAKPGSLSNDPNDYLQPGEDPEAAAYSGKAFMSTKKGPEGVDVVSKGMPTLGDRTKAIQDYRPPMMAEFLRGKSPQQIQAFMSGGAGGLFGAVKPPMLQRFEEMRGEANEESTRQKKQLMGMALADLDKNPTNPDSSQALLTLATDLGKNPFELRKSAVERPSLINYIVTNGVKVNEAGVATKYTPEEAAQLVDSGGAHLAVQATLARNEKVRSNLEAIKAFEASNPDPRVAAAARQVALSGGDVSVYLKQGQEGLQRAIFREKWGPIISFIERGGAISGIDTKGQPYNPNYSDEDIGKMFGDISSHDPDYANYLQTKVAANLTARHNEDIKNAQLAESKSRVAALADEQKSRQMARDYGIADRWGKDELAAINRRNSPPPVDKKTPEQVAEWNRGLDEEIDNYRQRRMDAEGAADLKWGHTDGRIMADRDNYDNKIEQYRKIPDKNEQIRKATLLLKGLYQNAEAYGKGSSEGNKKWMDFYKEEQQKIIDFMHEPAVKEGAPFGTSDTESTPQMTPRTVPLPSPQGLPQAPMSAETRARRDAWQQSRAQEDKEYEARNQLAIETYRRPYVQLLPHQREEIARRIVQPPAIAPQQAPTAPAVTPPGRAPREEFNFPDRRSAERAQLDAASPGGDFNALPQEMKSIIFHKVMGGQPMLQPATIPR